MPKRSGLQKMLYVVVAALVLYGVIVALVFAVGPSILFPRTRLSADDVAELGRAPGWTTTRLAVADGVELVGLVRASARADAPWLVFFGGNAFSLATSQHILDEIGTAGEGAAVFAYRGYDGSGGEPSEPALIADALAVVASLESQGVPPGRIILVGQSVGTGVVIQAAAALSARDRPPRGVVLLSPYTSIRQVFQDQVPVLPIGWAVRDPLDSTASIAAIRAPILMIHGDGDRLIGPDHSAALAALVEPGAVQRVVLAGRAHNDLWRDPATASTIRAFLDQR
ncbi:MAG: alpha/beta hydrolase [Nannocystaceae bacterium]